MNPIYKPASATALLLLSISCGTSPTSDGKSSTVSNETEQKELYIEHCIDPQHSICLIEKRVNKNLRFFTNSESVEDILMNPALSRSKITFEILNRKEYNFLEGKVQYKIEWDFTGKNKNADVILEDCDDDGKCVLGTIGGAITGGLAGAGIGVGIGTAVGGPAGAAGGGILGGLAGAVGGAATGAAASCFDGCPAPAPRPAPQYSNIGPDCHPFLGCETSL